jgi:hypothetical protein
MPKNSMFFFDRFTLVTVASFFVGFSFFFFSFFAIYHSFIDARAKQK